MLINLMNNWLLIENNLMIPNLMAPKIIKSNFKKKIIFNKFFWFLTRIVPKELQKL
jgi:hypothetical protein